MNEQVQQIPIKQISVVSNVRSDMDVKKLDELMQSVAAGGIRQPLVLAPQRAAGQIIPNKYRVVFGHRRLAAAMKLELTTVPALVRDIPDSEIESEQLVENVQREDLHPLDRAEGFFKLKQLGFDREQIAQKVGMARSTVELGLRLHDLVDAGKSALREGWLPQGAADELALIPPTLQGKALKELEYRNRRDGEISVSHARELLRSEFRLDLGEALFNPKDEQLLPAAGSCVACPKRTGAQPELFGEKKADICTDIGCFRAKEGAWLKLQEKTGRRVLTGAETKAIFDEYSSSDRLRYNADYVRADDKENVGSNGRAKTYRAALGKEGKDKIVLARAPGGAVVELIKRSDIPSDKSGSAPVVKHEKSAAEKAAAEAHKVRRLVAERALNAIATAANEKDLSARDADRLIVEDLLESVGNDRRKLLASYLEANGELKVGEGWDGATKALRARLGRCKSDAHLLVGFAFQLIGAAALGSYGTLDALKPACKLLDVDLVGIQKDVELERREAKKEKAAKKVEKISAKKKISKLDFRVDEDGVIGAHLVMQSGSEFRVTHEGAKALAGWASQGDVVQPGSAIANRLAELASAGFKVNKKLQRMHAKGAK